VDNDTAKVEASFVDYQTGRVWSKEKVVSKVYKTAKGTMARHPDDRFYGVVCEAEASKLLRECIVRCVPPGLRAELEQCVNEQLDSFLDEKTTEKIVAQFASKGVTVEMIEKHLGKRVSSMTQDDRATMLGLWNAIKDGEATVDEVFGKQAADDKPTPDRLAEKMAGKQEPEADPKESMYE